MQPTKVFEEDWDVEAQLAELFGTTKGELAEVAEAAAGAKADAVEDDPITTPGTFAYIYGTRALRRLFRAKGWARNRSNGIESVYDAERGIKIIFQNADSAADLSRDPRAISGKGNAAKRAVDLGQGNLFPEIEEEDVKEATAAIWYFLVYIDLDNDDIRAELSRPRKIEESQFYGFHERIFVIKKGDLDPFTFDAEDDEPPQEFDVNITRK